jgi:hypothetical protein
VSGFDVHTITNRHANRSFSQGSPGGTQTQKSLTTPNMISPPRVVVHTSEDKSTIQALVHKSSCVVPAMTPLGKSICIRLLVNAWIRTALIRVSL